MRVILRAMKETIQLWIHMHSYQPPQNAKNPRPYYALGDTLLGVGIGTVTAIATAVFRRRK
jgi:hypothetical protein